VKANQSPSRVEISPIILDPAGDSGNRRLLEFAGFIIAVALLTVLQLKIFSLPPDDDAYISFRYAFNALLGHGLVWNVGEYVEGFSNPLFTLLLIPFAPQAETAAWLLTFISHLAGAGFVFLLAGHWRLPRWPLGLLAGTAPAAILSVQSLLETSLFAALFSGVIWSRTRRRSRALAAMMTMLALVRPEGALVLGLFILYDLLEPERRAFLRATLWPLAPIAAIAAWEIFRIGYYHDFLPNTFYAKSGSPLGNLKLGLPYVLGFFLFSPALAAGLWPAKRNRPLAVLAGIWILYVIAIGGDWLYYHRFLVHLLPVLLLSGALLLRRRRVLLGVYLVLILIGFTALETKWLISPVRTLALEANAFSDHFSAMTEAEDGETVAMGRIGYFGYRNMNLRVLDMFGLTDRHIARTPAHEEVGLKAHDHYDADYVLSRRPDFFITSKVFRTSSPDRLVIDNLNHLHFEERDLLNHPAFRREYRPVAKQLGRETWIWYWQRADRSPAD